MSSVLSLDAIQHHHAYLQRTRVGREADHARQPCRHRAPGPNHAGDHRSGQQLAMGSGRGPRRGVGWRRAAGEARRRGGHARRRHHGDVAGSDGRAGVVHRSRRRSHPHRRRAARAAIAVGGGAARMDAGRPHLRRVGAGRLREDDQRGQHRPQPGQWHEAADGDAADCEPLAHPAAGEALRCPTRRHCVGYHTALGHRGDRRG